VTLSLERRRELVRLADEYGMPVLEDDPCGQLRYEGEHIPPLVALDAKYRGLAGTGSTGNVLYLSTFSKTLAPGLRLGWIIGPVDVIQRLAQAKQGADLHTSSFTQRVACEVARSGFLDRHMRTLRPVYKARRDAMLSAVSREFPAGVTWTIPSGGLFIWAELPPSIDTAVLLKEALEEKVAFVPGDAFHADGSGRNTMRLNFTNTTVDQIAAGIARLGQVIKRASQRALAAAATS
jgi:2-aminoadipate transaminase